MAKTCKELFEGFQCTIIGNPEEEVSGIAYRSDAVNPGDAFCCIVGLKADGHSFAQDAINRGARVLVVERKVYLADATDVTEVVVSDSRKAMAHMAAQFHDMPSAAFNLVGITGTNGKTTTTYLVECIASHMGARTGVIGTVGVRLDGKQEALDHTTPESPDLQQLFAQMRSAKCDVVAMEVSSHALSLDRTWGTQFAVTAFTNLTQDHLDYHKTFESYFDAKALLFSSNYPAKRVINIDSKWGQELRKRVSEADEPVITTGWDERAQVHPVAVEYTPTNTTLTLSVRGEELTFTYPLVGRFNVENVLTAVGIGLMLGYRAADIVEALKSASPVPGRVQRVEAANTDISVYVDYAHTPDALEKAIASVAELTSGRTIVVFGCGGDRDTSKRPIMGRAALAANFVVVTSDNPRTENPEAIIADILEGMGGAQEGEAYEVEPDRAAAIARAIALAEPGDAVLIAGKGHEDYQIIGTEKHHFSDVEVAAEELGKVQS